MKRLILFFIASCLLMSGCHISVSRSYTTTVLDTLVVMSYNVENFFHCEDDPEKDDEEFTPEGKYHWNYSLMEDKAQKIKKVILAGTGTHNGPSIIGLCEIEGEKAVDYLIKTSGLNQLGYKGLIYPTPDKRGIAVALIYDSYRVKIIDSKPINVSIPEQNFYTRDILYAKIKYKNTKEDYHIFVNHWPSKRGGGESDSKREHVAKQLRHFCDSLKSVDPDAKMIMIGDFNDTADAAAITDVLGAKSEGTPYINLSNDTKASSYKYRGKWGTIDHVIVSESLCKNGRPVYKVCDLDFITEEDDRYGGTIPFRAYHGPTYHKGYSDHYPVMVKIKAHFTENHQKGFSF